MRKSLRSPFNNQTHVLTYLASDALFVLFFFFSCPVDQYLNYKVSDSSYQRFSFDAFKMDDAEVMYLHCEVLVCANNEKNTTRCAEGCVENNPGGSRRKRRDETNQERKEMTSLGPVKVLLDTLLVQGPDGGKSNLLNNQNSSLLFWRILKVELRLLDCAKKIKALLKWVGGVVASWFVRSSPDQAVRAQVLAGDIVLCSWARHFTLTVPLSTQVYKKSTGDVNAGGNPAMD